MSDPQLSQADGVAEAPATPGDRLRRTAPVALAGAGILTVIAVTVGAVIARLTTTTSQSAAVVVMAVALPIVLLGVLTAGPRVERIAQAPGLLGNRSARR